MATIRTFEDLEIWKAARVLCRETFVLTQRRQFAKDFSLKDQINRAAGSIMDNIAEGFERGGTRELIQFLYIGTLLLVTGYSLVVTCYFLLVTRHQQPITINE